MASLVVEERETLREAKERETGIQLGWRRDVSWLIGFLGIIAHNAHMFKLGYEAFFSGRKGLSF